MCVIQQELHQPSLQWGSNPHVLMQLHNEPLRQSGLYSSSPLYTPLTGLQGVCIWANQGWPQPGRSAAGDKTCKLSV